MRGLRSILMMALIGCGIALEATPTVWTPASDALPSTTPRFTETPLGRFETIAVGSFPIVLFYVGFGFDMADYANSGFQRSYAPWPFKSANAAAPSQDELGLRLQTAVLLSLGVAVLDAVLKPLALARREARRSDAHFPKPDAAGETKTQNSGSGESSGTESSPP